MPGCNTPKGERVPAHLVVPLIQDYLSRYETEGFEGEWGGASGKARKARLEKLSPLWILAQEAGLEPSTIRKWILGYRKTLAFSDVDKVFTAMGKASLWRTPQLFDIYYGIEFKPKPWEEAIINGAG